jgi:hypothetical protein
LLVLNFSGNAENNKKLGKKRFGRKEPGLQTSQLREKVKQKKKLLTSDKKIDNVTKLVDRVEISNQFTKLDFTVEVPSSSSSVPRKLSIMFEVCKVSRHPAK